MVALTLKIFLQIYTQIYNILTTLREHFFSEDLFSENTLLHDLHMIRIGLNFLMWTKITFPTLLMIFNFSKFPSSVY